MRRAFITLVALLGAWSCIDTEGQRDIVGRFVDAWSRGDYAAMRSMTGHQRAERVSRAEFAQWMSNHPFLGTVTGFEGFGVEGQSPTVGRILTERGPHPIVMRLAISGDWYVTDVQSGGYSLLPPAWPAEKQAAAFLRALVDRDWKRAWNHTHPSFQKHVSEDTFAKTYASNVWLFEALGFRLRVRPATADAPIVEGALTSKDGSAQAVIHLGRQGEKYFVTEAHLGGTPTFPKPARVIPPAERTP